ncbi:MAG: AfsR/SARP family transcriptional regulator [Chloroflexota bacterium]
MATLKVRLFGRFSFCAREQTTTIIGPGRTQDLLCYLLLHRGRPHNRETLASALWSEQTAAQSRKSLRQALWQLRTCLEDESLPDEHHLLVVEAESVRVNPDADLWLDVAEFEEAYARVKLIRGQALDASAIRGVREACQLYVGDLLESVSQDWCTFERVRLQGMYIALLEKDMVYSETNGQYEGGLESGNRILACDRAHERIHRRMMRLHYLSGGRTEALRQYERCAAALGEDLGIKPARSTTLLYEQIRVDQVDHPGTRSGGLAETSSDALPITPATLTDWLDHLKQLRRVVADLQRRVRGDIETIERYLNTER